MPERPNGKSRLNDVCCPPSMIVSSAHSIPAHRVRHRAYRLGVGVSVFCAALLASDATVTEALAGDRAGTLSWGPALFRALLAWHGIVLLLVAVVAWRGRRSDVPLAPPADEEKRESLPVRRHLFWVTLALLSVLALALRLWRLDTCLWLDEVLTLTRFARPPLGTILTSYPDNNQHMLYSVLAHFSLVLFGESAWAVRLPAVLFGVGSIGALYVLGKLTTDRTEAMLAAVLMTVSYHHVWFSQNARGYTGLLFFTLLATGLFIRGLREERWALWLTYAVSVALGFWIHLTFLFVVLSHACVYAWLFLTSFRNGPAAHRGTLSPAVRWRPLAALALGATLTVQLYALALPQFFSSAMHEVSLPSEWTQPFWLVRETLASLRIGFAGYAGILAALAFVLAGLVSLAHRDRIAAALFVLPGVVGATTMLFLQQNLWPRFFFYCVGFAFLVLVRGMMVLGSVAAAFLRTRPQQRQVWVHRLGTAGVLMLATVLAAMLPRCYALPKQDYLGAKAFVESQRARGEPVVAVGLAALTYGSYYAPEWATPPTCQALDAIRQQSERTWLVYTFLTQLKTVHPDLARVIQEDFEIVKVFPGTLHAGEIYVCRSQAKAKPREPRESVARSP